jgi:SARP family transcriptional regulator, regulator of embCAB operon
VKSGVLGSLFLRVGAADCAPSAPKQRNVFAMLLVHVGQVVPVSYLMRELWEDRPPVSGATTLQTYILNLRKWLASIMGCSTAEIMRDVLVTHAGGYSLRTGTEDFDALAYGSLVAAGRDALSVSDYGAAVLLLGDALKVWRGPALADVQVGRVLESKRRQFEESRLGALECLVDAQFRLGRYREVLTELAAVTVENPLHEGLRAQYMRALYLSGRRAQALAAFQQLREDLVSELGIEPGSPVQQVHQAILNSNSEFEVPVQRERAVKSVAGGIAGVFRLDSVRQC